MSAARIAVLVILLAGVAAAVWFVVAPRTSQAVEQPLAFSHKKHQEQDLACLDCHAGAEKDQYATLPSMRACALCHKEVKGESPAAAEVTRYIEEGLVIPWQQVNRVVGHVYFSHKAHVRYGEMACAECHGEMATLETPVTSSQVEHLDMEACMDCHQARGAANDCLTCHR